MDYARCASFIVHPCKLLCAPHLAPWGFAPTLSPKLPSHFNRGRRWNNCNHIYIYIYIERERENINIYMITSCDAHLHSFSGVDLCVDKLAYVNGCAAPKAQIYSPNCTRAAREGNLGQIVYRQTNKKRGDGYERGPRIRKWFP